MTSQRVKNKKVRHETKSSGVTVVLYTLWRLLWSITVHTHGKCNLFVLYNKNSNGLLKIVYWRDLAWIWRHLCVCVSFNRSTNENSHRSHVKNCIQNVPVYRIVYNKRFKHKRHKRTTDVWYNWYYSSTRILRLVCSRTSLNKPLTSRLSCVYTLRLIWPISYPGECDLVVHTRKRHFVTNTYITCTKIRNRPINRSV